LNGRWTAFALLFLLVSTLAIADVQESVPATSYETLVGCLERSTGGDFVLRGAAQQVMLQPAGGMDKHLGRTVKVTGRWQGDAPARTLRVAKIEYVAAGCG
jgi:hypothetical protein